LFLRFGFFFLFDKADPQEAYAEAFSKLVRLPKKVFEWKGEKKTARGRLTPFLFGKRGGTL
jgi:hypothetical protein